MLFKKRRTYVKRRLGPSLIELLRHELSFLKKVEETNRFYILGLKKTAFKAEKLVEKQKKRAEIELRRLEEESLKQTEKKIKRIKAHSKRKINAMKENFDKSQSFLLDLLEEVINGIELI